MVACSRPSVSKTKHDGIGGVKKWGKLGSGCDSTQTSLVFRSAATKSIANCVNTQAKSCQVVVSNLDTFFFFLFFYFLFFFFFPSIFFRKCSLRYRGHIDTSGFHPKRKHWSDARSVSTQFWYNKSCSMRYYWTVPLVWHRPAQTRTTMTLTNPLVESSPVLKSQEQSCCDVNWCNYFQKLFSHSNTLFILLKKLRPDRRQIWNSIRGHNNNNNDKRKVKEKERKKEGKKQMNKRTTKKWRQKRTNEQRNERKNERTDWGTNEQTNEQTNKRTKERTNEQRKNEDRNERTNERTKERKNEQTNERMNERTQKSMNDELQKMRKNKQMKDKKKKKEKEKKTREGRN